MLRVNILSNDKDIIIKLPKSSHELAAELRKAGIDISPERLTLKSNVGHNYLIGLYTEDPLGDVVIDRICDILRHTYATVCIEKEFDPKALSE